MSEAREFLKGLLDALLPNRAAPTLGRVIKAHEGAGINRYSVDVRVLKVGSLEETGQVIKEVPISPLWASKKKRGVYAIPPEGQVVIVGFLGWDIAYPYVAGVWADEYEAGEFRKDRYVVTDGDGMVFAIDATKKTIIFDNGQGCAIFVEPDKLTIDNGKVKIVLNGDKVSAKNGSKNLFTILDTHLSNLAGMKTVGSPSQHTVDPGDIAKFNQDRAALSALLEA